MPIVDVWWDFPDDDPDGNVEHIARHGLSQDDVEHALHTQYDSGFSRSSGLPIAFGMTEDGRHIAVIYEEIDEHSIRPVTAYEV